MLTFGRLPAPIYLLLQRVTEISDRAHFSERKEFLIGEPGARPGLGCKTLGAAQVGPANLIQSQTLFGQNLDVRTLLLIDDRGRGFSEAIDCEELHLGTLVASK